MRLDNPCPSCGRPIADSAFVCHECVRELQAKLRTAAAWIDTGRLDDVVGRRTRTNIGVIRPRPIARGVYQGPWCYGGGWDCGHPSCWVVWYSIHVRSVEAGGRIEDPIANESAGVMNEGAAETRWIVDTTARAWATFVHRQRGTLIPVARPRVEPVEHLRPRADVDDPAERTPWCIWGDLPFDQCGCGRPHRQEAS